MALNLSLDDLKGPHETWRKKTKQPRGLHVWWLTVKGRKTPLCCVAWDSLVLINAEPSWPPGTPPALLSGSGGDSYRVVYMKGLGRVLARPGVPVPQVSPLLLLKRGSCPILRYRKLLGLRKWAVLLDAHGQPVYRAWRPHLMRVAAWLGEKSPEGLELRKGPGPLVLVYKKRQLRAALGLSPLGEGDA